MDAAPVAEQDPNKNPFAAPPMDITAVPAAPVQVTGMQAAQNGGEPAIPIDQLAQALPAPTQPAAQPIAVSAPAPALSQTTSHGGKSTSGAVATKEEAAIQLEQDKLDQQAVKNQEKTNELAIKKAQIQEESANKAAALAAQREDDQRRELDKYEGDVKWRQAIADDADKKYKQQLSDFHNPKNGFWARAETPQKVAGGLALILGLFGGRKDGHNVGAEKIEQAIDEDTAKRRQQLTDQLGILERSKSDVTATKNDLKRRVDMLDMRNASALESAAAMAEARARRLGMDEAEIAGNDGIAKLRASALNRREKYQEGLRTTVKADQAWSKVTLAGGAGGGGVNDTRLNPSTEDLAGVNNAADAIKRLDRTLGVIDQDPKAWGEYRQNNLSWKKSQAMDNIPGLKQLRAGAQVVGAANVAPEQGLKSENAKDIHRAIDQLRTSIAKGFGGVITTGDRDAADSLLALAAVSEPKAAQRLLLQAREKLVNGVRFTISNRKMAVPEGVLPPAGGGQPAAPSQAAPASNLPPGAIPGTARGHRGYFLNGKFHPTG